MSGKHTNDAAGTVREFVKRMIDHHVRPNHIGRVTQVAPVVVVQVAHSSLALSENETLLLAHAVRQYDQEIGLLVGDSLLLVPTSGGDWVATAVLTPHNALGGVERTKVTTGGTLGGTVTGGGTTVSIPLVGKVPYYDQDGLVVGNIPIV